ncbi:hypothetical protein E2C01_075213 [Portunus trituberculatus]|uniref:Uncharacterized protein n=1 Tax=Portunus trituberculatus TaxID=210409 RepID=A0A5B7IFL5_PORTR|nr:hypothetical protein [Portunus trituberculatus]
MHGSPHLASRTVVIGVHKILTQNPRKLLEMSSGPSAAVPSSKVWLKWRRLCLGKVPGDRRYASPPPDHTK